MKDFQKRMIEEHSQLVLRINSLSDYIYSDKSNKDDKVEFANKCVQLAAMKKYEEALCARLENSGIVFEEGTYFERVASIKTCLNAIQTFGNDYDKDKDKLEKPNDEQ